MLKLGSWVLHAMTRRQLEQYDVRYQQKWQLGWKGRKQPTETRVLLLLLLLVAVVVVVLCSNKNMQRKEYEIIITSDSHTGCCAWNMKTHFSDKSEVNGLVKPGSATNVLVRSAEMIS
jgi:hypothetical protein